MSLTPSKNIKLGSRANHFELLDTISNSNKSLSELKGVKGTLIMFICNHCPFVIHINSILVSLANEYQSKGISFIAISSNDVENYPQDAPVLMKENAEKENYPFPYLYDETQKIAKNFGATCTPDLFLYNADLKLYYHGQLDDSRPGNNIECNGQDLKIAFDNVLENKDYPKTQIPSIGCNIKWK